MVNNPLLRPYLSWGVPYMGVGWPAMSVLGGGKNPSPKVRAQKYPKRVKPPPYSILGCPGAKLGYYLPSLHWNYPAFLNTHLHKIPSALPNYNSRYAKLSTRKLPPVACSPQRLCLFFQNWPSPFRSLRKKLQDRELPHRVLWQLFFSLNTNSLFQSIYSRCSPLKTSYLSARWVYMTFSVSNLRFSQKCIGSSTTIEKRSILTIPFPPIKLPGICETCTIESLPWWLGDQPESTTTPTFLCRPTGRSKLWSGAGPRSHPLPNAGPTRATTCCRHHHRLHRCLHRFRLTTDSPEAAHASRWCPEVRQTKFRRQVLSTKDLWPGPIKKGFVQKGSCITTRFAYKAKPLIKLPIPNRHRKNKNRRRPGDCTATCCNAQYSGDSEGGVDCTNCKRDAGLFEARNRARHHRSHSSSTSWKCPTSTCNIGHFAICSTTRGPCSKHLLHPSLRETISGACQTSTLVQLKPPSTPWTKDTSQEGMLLATWIHASRSRDHNVHRAETRIFVNTVTMSYQSKTILNETDSFPMTTLVINYYTLISKTMTSWLQCYHTRSFTFCMWGIGFSCTPFKRLLHRPHTAPSPPATANTCADAISSAVRGSSNLHGCFNASASISSTGTLSCRRVSSMNSSKRLDDAVRRCWSLSSKILLSERPSHHSLFGAPFFFIARRTRRAILPGPLQRSCFDLLNLLLVRVVIESTEDPPSSDPETGALVDSTSIMADILQVNRWLPLRQWSKMHCRPTLILFRSDIAHAPSTKCIKHCTCSFP